MEETLDVLVIGSCMTDLICYAPRLPHSGETISGSKFTTGFGGKGANQCVAAAKLGASCALVAKLGDDTFGKNYMANLKDSGINTDHVTICNGSSGVAQICVADNGENSIVIIPGANDKLSYSDIDAAECLIRKSKCVLFQFETPLETTLYALKKCRKYNCITVVNAAPAYSDIDIELLQMCDILCLNEIEAEMITSISIKSVADGIDSVKELLSAGCKSCIITLGSNGVVFASEQHPIPIHVSVEPVLNPVDTTGAGDAFIGAMAFYLSNFTIDMTEVIERSCLAARFSVCKPGTQSSFPSIDDISSAKTGDSGTIG